MKAKLQVYQIRINYNQFDNQFAVDIMNTLIFINNSINNQGGPMTVTQLDLSNCNLSEFTPQIKLALQSCPNLYQLKLVNCLLKSLDFLPSLNIQIIDLSQNRLNDLQICKLIQYKDLKQLSLKDNLIQSLENLQILDKLTNLTQLDLFGNPLCSTSKKYRNQMFQRLKTLEIIDNQLRNGEQISDDDQKEDEQNNLFIFDKKYDSQQLEQEDLECQLQKDPFQQGDFNQFGQEEDFDFQGQGFCQQYMGNKKRKY